ncbi:MAG: glycine cleavage system aminomethyltransferase GcvT [Candidatus Eisenbacteria bacterium]|uniref:Aminomethyltransferase n=1 Tax=Eiseniibacteriota bacterium TaxID=2212470 RepID=A0A937X9B0_UNCEI|nr:glycine cleavage system aminomethyltransferase GcvT [Candidatus Eisenbacteria bacterium]
MAAELRRTPFHAFHRDRGGRLVPFAGWEMPVQFPGGVIHEHLLVRRAAGMFDVAHMGRFFLRGPGALAYANRLITNNLEKLAPGQLLYSALCHEQGGMIDDLTVYRLDEGALIVANAANAAKVSDWIAAHKPAGVEFEDATERLAQIALQGPRAEAVLRSPLADAVREVGYYRYTRLRWEGEELLISRNGYTGEDGFEIYVPAAAAPGLWERLLEWGAAEGVEPIGLGARDSLRMEVNYALYGNELGPDITPLEAGLRWVVKMKDHDFIGREALQRRQEAGLTRALVGFEVEGKRLPRHGHPILAGGREAGVVTSGGYCPSLDRGMGMGFVTPDLQEVGTAIEIDARGARLAARVVERPFYKQGSVRRA